MTARRVAFRERSANSESIDAAVIVPILAGTRVMSRRCELTGKGGLTGNNVSHAHNKTKRRYLPNLNRASLQSETLGRTFRLRVSAYALRNVDHRGGLDAFLDKASDEVLSPKAQRIKRDIARARREAQTAADA